MRAFVAAILVGTFAVGCAHAPRTAYTFDPGPGGWELDDHAQGGGYQHETYTHPVHGERLEVWEIDRPAPGATSIEFSTLAPASRVLPPMGSPTAVPRSLGDDDLGGAQGYWVAQAGRDRDALVQAADFVAPGGRRHYVVRMSSPDDDVEQLRAWLRDILLRNFRFPAPVR